MKCGGKTLQDFCLVKLQNLLKVSLIPFTSGGFKLKNVTHHHTAETKTRACRLKYQQFNSTRWNFCQLQYCYHHTSNLECSWPCN